MNFNYVLSKKNLIRFLWLIFYISIPFYSESILAQKLDIQYKFRDNNRWEGVRSIDRKDVSSALELASLIYYHEGFRLEKTKKDTNSMSIFFNSPISKDVMVSIFNLDEKYFMEPHPKNFNKPNWNKFEWPTMILDILKLKMKDLNGIATSRLENKKIYLPIYFVPPEEIDIKKFDMEFSMYAGRGMLVDIKIYTEGLDEPIKNWDNVKLIKYQLKTLYWQVYSNFYNKNNFRMVVTEKPKEETKIIKPEDEFNIFIGR